jgi:hypothetical protein
MLGDKFVLEVDTSTGEREPATTGDVADTDEVKYGKVSRY